MWILNIILFVVFLLGFLLFRKPYGDWMENLDKKEHKLYILYPLANAIIIKTGLEKLLTNKNNSNEAIKALYVTTKPENLNRLFWCSRIALVMVIVILFDVLSLISGLADVANSSIIEGNYLERPDYGDGNTKIELSVGLEPKEGNNPDISSKPETQEVIIDVRERIYNQEEITKLFDQAEKYLDREVLGNNSSAKQVREKLNFCKTIPGTGISVDWIPEDYSLIEYDGTLNNVSISKEGIATTVKAVLTYYEEKNEHNIAFTILPKQFSEEEMIRKELTEAIKAYSDRTAIDRLLELPREIENYSLQWSDKEEKSSPSLFLCGIIIAIIAWLYGKRELDIKMKKRKEQMLLDYPEIINKFTLLINAGMTIKQAWAKIAEDYINKTLKNGIKKRYAYEEMLTTLHELQLGLPENSTYEQFGRRTGLIPYIKFSSFVSQNLKKGTKGFTQLLMQEAMESFEDRKESAKRRGEEAGTKLLIPMMLMLIIVFLMIMIPAFMAFQIV